MYLLLLILPHSKPLPLATPIPCDIDPHDLNLDISDFKSRITAKTKCVMPVFYAGDCSKAEEIYQIALERNIRVVGRSSCVWILF